ncbi:MAG: TPM domain-containing protein [Chthoniobacteraceae bacterium]
MARALVFAWLALTLASARAAEPLPPKPAAYFNDYAGAVSGQTATTLDEKLRQFERDTSNQIVVAVFQKMQSAAAVQDFTFRTAESWKVGQKDRDNGAVLFVFISDRTMFIQVGYGLEGVLADVTAKRIIDEEIAPEFKAGRFDAGLTRGVDAMLAATRGEYKGTGRVAGDDSNAVNPLLGFAVLALIIFILSRISKGSRSGKMITRYGTVSWSSGGGSSSSGGGFSGGGGSFGGGGAGGSW